MACLQLKFHDKAPEHERASVLEQIRAAPARPEPLFPGEDDPELASMYLIEDVAERDADALTRALGAHDAVEVVEPAASRRLIR